MCKTVQQLLSDNQRIGRGYDSKGFIRALSEREFFEVSEEMGWNQNNPEYRKLFENLTT